MFYWDPRKFAINAHRHTNSTGGRFSEVRREAPKNARGPAAKGEHREEETTTATAAATATTATTAAALYE